MADRRRRSPEGSSRTKGKEPTRAAYDEPPRMTNYTEQARMRPGAEEVVYSSSSSSSSSSSYIDISRTYSRKFGLRAFFTAPSERRRLRRRRSSRLFRNANSSSSTVNSDLAYGTGFIKRPKRRGVRARNGREIGTERASDRENNRRSRGERREEAAAAARGPLARAQTDAEILAIGAGLAKLARDQNRRDLMEARNSNRGDLIAGGSTTGFNNQGPSRGLVNSRPSHGSDTVDEEGWESASESEESVDSRLAFGEPSKSSGGFFGLFGRKKGRPLSRKDSVVDPRLFGPQNTLHGIVTEPVGFDEVTPWASTNDFGQQFSEGPGIGPSHTGSQASLQRVYPVPTSDPGRFDARAASEVSGPEPMVVSRPGPIPIQQPQPMVPISQSVYGRRESGSISKRDSTSSGRGKSLAEAALVGVAGAAVGATIASSRDDRKRKEDEESDERTRIRRRDSEKESKDDRRREKRGSPDREERREKRREKDDSSRVSSDKRRERRKDETREERDERRRLRDEPRDEKDERRENRQEERRNERSDGRGEARRTKSETAVPTTVIDPFQYQVPDDAFETVATEPSQRTIEAAPAVHYVTVEREPDFSRIAPIRDARTPDFMHMHRQNPPKYVDSGPGDREYDSRDRALHEAEEIYEETTHSTAPIAAAAFGAAVAAVHHADAERETRSDKRRDERRGEKGSSYDDYDSKPRDKKPEKERDPVQEEADRAYREIVMARKIASQVIRSRSNSPDRSVVEKYTAEEEEEPVRIVTPPGMEDQKKVGPYDAPNADFQLDHVLEDPLDLRNFRISPTNMVRVDAEGPYLKRDPDADRPRPFLNLVHPTPTPSPAPEKQADRSEPATSSEPKDRRDSKRSSTSDVKSKDEVVDSPTASNVSKGVTWGENETKHFEVESPTEHRDEFVSKSDINARESQEEPQPSASPKSKGWAALRGAFMGAAAAAAAASSSETSKASKSKEEKDAPYEYRGVAVEPESPPQSSSQRDAPPAGPKPSASETSRVPGAFNDDLDFTATVAAGLQDSGFDPNIVIDDPSFRRRNSPPGSNDFTPYRTPFAETVSDLGAIPSEVSGPQGYILGEVASTPQDWRSVSPPEDDGTATKLSKKEQKKRDKERRRSGDVTPLEESSAMRDVVEEPERYFEPPLSKKEQKKRDKLARQTSQGDDITPSVADEIVEEPESYFETPKKSKKKSKKGSSGVDDYVEETSRDSRKVSVPVDAFDDLRNDDDEWADAKKSKKKSKRDSDRHDSPARSVPSSEIASELERSSSKKSKDKSKRKSEQHEADPTETSLPASTPSETSRDGDFDDSRGNRKSSTRDSGIFSSADRGDSRSVVSADASRYGDDEPRKTKKKSRSSTKDDYDDSRSVVSAPAGDDYEDSKRTKKKDKDKDREKDKKSGGGLFGLFGSKSDVGARDESPKGSKDDFEEPKKKKKSKRSSVADSSSIYSDIGAQSVGDLSRSVSNGNGDKNGAYDDGDDSGEKTKTRSRSENQSSKKDSFLGSAGTLGAGVGIAGAAVAIAAQQYQQSKAANVNSRETVEHEQRKSSPSPILPHEIHDPEITERQFRPSIDPQYGDLLPLPPSDPVSPNVDPIDDLPELPESRPDTPEPERITREKSMSAVRKNIQETPVKSPSQSAVPLNFLMRNRPQPSSPRFVRSSPLQSPATPHEDSLFFPKARSRPTSWDNSKEYKPLYLVESHRRGSGAQMEMEEDLPALPPSQGTSRSSSQLEIGELAKDPLSIDTDLASSKSAELLGSEQSTPKAAVMTRDDHAIDDSFDDMNLTAESGLSSHPERRPSSPVPKSHFREHVAEAAAAAGLVSAIGYFASSPTYPENKESSLDELPSVPRQPSPVDPMTKDRSSYLLQSSPLSKKFEEFEPVDRDLDSPSRNQKSSRSSSNAMESIQEREATDVFGSPKARPEDIEYEHEQTTDVLSTSPYDDLADQEKTHELPELLAKDLHELDGPTVEETEPVDEFTFTKPKKDKKRDKKKGKGLSRSSTQDDFTIPDASKDGAEKTPGPAEAKPTDDEFFITKSKKDKKKGKGLSRSLTEDDMVIPEPSKDIAEETRGPPETEPAQDEFFVTKSKKDKKKDKKKTKSVSAWEPEEPESVPHQIEEPVAEITRDVSKEIATPADVEPLHEFSTPKSKKDKDKKDKKKFVVAWEPEASESAALTTEEFPQEPTRTLLEETPIAADNEPLEETKASESTVQTTKEFPQEPTRTLLEDTSIAADNEPLEEFVITKSKKDKKKNKRKSVAAWQPEASESAAQTTEELPRELTQTLLEDTPIAADNEPLEEFVITKSKKDKKKGKRKSVATEEPDAYESVPQTIEQPEQEPTRAMFEDVSIPVENEAVGEFFTTNSKKGKKKDKKQAKPPTWEPEEEITSQPLAEPTVEKNRVFAEETTTPAEIEATEDFSFGKSKKNKKKDKKRSRPTSTVGTEKDETEAPVLDTTRDLVEEPVSILHESSAPETAIAEPATDLAISQAPEDHEEIIEAEFTPKDSRLEPVEDVAQEPPVSDDFTAFETKKVKKKKGKSLMSWGQEEEEAVPTESVPEETQQDTSRDVPEDAPAADQFFVTRSKESKKEKKQRGELVTAWEPEEDSAALPTAPEFEDTQDFDAATFKRGKKMNRKSSSFVPDDDLSSTARQEPVESLAAQDDTPRSIDVPESEESHLPAENLPTTEQVKSIEPENILDAPESLSSKPTPMGGPGAWPITPATPWTGGDVPNSSSKEYFPSTETSHGPLNREMPEDLQSKESFPFTETVMPIVAAGAAHLGAESMKKEYSHPIEGLYKDTTTSKSMHVNEPSLSQSDSKSAPDGFTAGSDNDQLSLAKRLQEEFSGGSKRSKKDKKRQSLPPTPAREASRSRTVEELPESHPRARSLSIGPPAPEAYSEDKLELARQFKADSESGSKKSKKDKKKRQGLSRSSTQDDLGFDRDVEDSQATVPEICKDSQDPETLETAPKGDGFAAGYQEDQLSLARQLQAEFGKKSKKDKKRRSTSQTPQDQVPRDDYFGEPSRAPIPDVMEQELTVQVPEPSVQDMARDGLAVRYSSEQLELARQLKEEFGSGSKKGKKDKKRRSTSQTPLEQEPRDDYFCGPSQPPLHDEDDQDRGASIPDSNAETGPTRDGLAVGYKMEQLKLARQLKEEFGSGSKKSKKDKKDKKRGSLLRTNTEDNYSSDAQPGDAESGNFEAPQPDFAEASPANEPEDEFSFVTKKSKKDKKDKKRGSLLLSNIEDDLPLDAQPREADSRNFEVQQELAEASPINVPEDESAFVTKKSKKDKKGKKRASLLPDTQGDVFPSETISSPTNDVAKTRDIDAPEPALFEEGPNESAQLEDDFGFTKNSEKDKKGKKRDSVLQTSAEDDLPAETRFEGRDESRNVGVLTQPDFTPEFSAEPVAVEPEDEFSTSTKKSRKDKKGKKPDIVLQSAAEEDIPIVDFGKEVETLHASRDTESREIGLEPAQAAPEADWSVPEKPSKKNKKKRQSTIAQEQPYGQPEVEASSTQPEQELSMPNSTSEAVDEASDDFGFSSKKSKKDKKKRGSLLRSATFDETPEEITSEMQPEYESRDLVDETGAATAPLADDQDDGFEYSSKKSKKDKKKRGSLIRSSTFDEIPVEQANDVKFQHDSENRDLGHGISATLASVADDQNDEFEYSSKKSKKDKKKRGSLLRSSTLDETPTEQVKDDKAPPEPESQDIAGDPGAAVAPLAVDQAGEAEYSSKKSKKEKKKRKSLPQTTMPEDLPKEIEQPRKQDDAVLSSVAEDSRPTIVETDRAPEPEPAIHESTFHEDKSLSQPANIITEREDSQTATREAAFEEDTSINQPEDEVSTSGPPDIFHDFAFTTKKSKKDKKNRKDSTKDDSEETSGVSTPLDPMAEPKPIVETSIPAEKEDTVPSDQPLERDLDSFTVPASAQQEEEPTDEWSSFSIKKSKKEKKRKASKTASLGPSIPRLEPILDPEVAIEERQLPTNELMEGNKAIEEPSSRAIEVPISQVMADDTEAPTDEWASFSNKKSKKDKKKSKSLSRSLSEGPYEIPSLSDPIVELETSMAEPSRPTENISKEQSASEVPRVPDEVTVATTKEDIEQPADERASFTTKKSKKDKKKRKSGLSTPAELTEEISSLEHASSFTEEPLQPVLESTEPAEEISSFEHARSFTEEPLQPVLESAKPTEISSFEHKGSFMEEPLPPILESAEPTEEISSFEHESSFTEKPLPPILESAEAEHGMPTVQKQEPLSRAFEDEVPENSETQVQDSEDLGPTNGGSKEQEATDHAFASVTKRSKKDRKGSKRSSRAPSESRASTLGPADALPIETTEAETHPPSGQIVSSPVTMKDENLEETHQAERHAVEQAVDDERKDPSGDDLFRTPSKKDKRKRQATVADISLGDGMDSSKPPLTSWADEVEEAEIERQIPVIQDIAKDESLSHIASTIETPPVDDFFRPTKKGKKGKKRISEPASSVESSRPATSSGMPKDEAVDDHSNLAILAATGAALAGAALLSKGDETREIPSQSAGSTTPQRKLSKKERKNKRIDLGPAPRDDIFDDPALWEGAEPKPHEEVMHVDDDSGSDGFGFASRDMDEPISTHQPYETREPTLGYGHHKHVEEARPVSPAAETKFIPKGSTRTRERETDWDNRHATTEAFQEDRDLHGEEQPERQISEELDQRSSTGDERTATQLPSSIYVPQEPIQHREDIYINDPHFSQPSRSIVDTPPSDKGVSFEEPPPIIHEHISTPSRSSSKQPYSEKSVAFEDVTDHSPARPLSTSKYGRTSFSDLPVVPEESEHPPAHPHHDFEGNRDSAFVTGSPIPRHQFTDDHEHVRDSGVHLRDFSPAEKARAHASSTDAALAKLSWPQVDEETETVDLHRSQRIVAETPTGHRHQERVPSETRDSHPHESHRSQGEKATNPDKAPLTSRDLFPSYKSTEEISGKHHGRDEGTNRAYLPSQHSTEERHTDLHRVPTIHESRKPREDSLVKQRLQRFESLDLQHPIKPKEDKYSELATSQRPKAERPKGMSEVEAGAAIAGASLGFAAARKLSQEQRPSSAQSQRSSSNINRLRTPDPKRPDSVASNRSGTPPLRRSDRKLSGDLRSLSQRSKPDLAKEAELAALASSTSVHTANPTANEGRVRAKDMATDVYVRFLSFDDRCDANSK
jgi:hypothetical protein